MVNNVHILTCVLIIGTILPIAFLRKHNEGKPPLTLFVTGLEGDRCRDNATCQMYYKHSYCKPSFDENYNELLDGTCTCDDGYVRSSDGKRCLAAYLKMGETCEDDRQCSNADNRAAVCVPGSEICDCIPDFYPSDNLEDCFRIVNVLGLQPCMDDIQCQMGLPGKLSYCVEKRPDHKGSQKVCKCKPGSVSGAGSNKCYPVAKYVGDTCECHAQCTVGLKYSLCVEGQCECSRGYELRQTDYFSECYPVTVQN